MDTTIREDELFKAFAHGLFLGCAVPIIGYNIKAMKVKNLLIYAAFLGFELYNIYDHLMCSRGKQ